MAEETASQKSLRDKEEIASQEWFKGTIEIIGSKTRTGLIRAEDGTLVEFDESGSTVFDQLSESDKVLYTLTGDGPDARGVMKAHELLLLTSDD